MTENYNSKCCQCDCSLKYDNDLGNYCNNIECLDNHNWEMLGCNCYSCNDCECYFWRCPIHDKEVQAQERIGIEKVRIEKHKLTIETEINLVQQILQNGRDGMSITEDDQKLINEVEQSHLRQIKGV